MFKGKKILFHSLLFITALFVSAPGFSQDCGCSYVKFQTDSSEDDIDPRLRSHCPPTTGVYSERAHCYRPYWYSPYSTYCYYYEFPYYYNYPYYRYPEGVLFFYRW